MISFTLFITIILFILVSILWLLKDERTFWQDVQTTLDKGKPKKYFTNLYKPKNK